MSIQAQGTVLQGGSIENLMCKCEQHVRDLEKFFAYLELIFPSSSHNLTCIELQRGYRVVIANGVGNSTCSQVPDLQDGLGGYVLLPNILTRIDLSKLPETIWVSSN